MRLGASALNLWNLRGFWLYLEWPKSKTSRRHMQRLVVRVVDGTWVEHDETHCPPLEAMLRPGDEVYKVIVTPGPATSVETMETTKPAAWPKRSKE
jgi:hypothetical protein